MKILYYYLILLILHNSAVSAQNYHAVQGSSSVGSLNVSNNPASIVNVADAWDIIPLSVQLKNSTNAFTILRYSYLSSPALSQYRVNGGNYSRYINNNFNVHLLNVRIAIGRTQAVAFGVNLRGYTNVKTGVYNYRDTVKTLRSFFLGNEANRILQAQAKNNSWLEFFGTYSKTIRDTELGRLNAGFTVKLTGGVSGMFAGLENGGLQRIVRNNKVSYVVGSGNGAYGYSSNYDEWRKDNSFSQNAGKFLRATQKSLLFDIGAEYLIKPSLITGGDDEDSYYDYTWKFGFSLLDLGRNKYQFGTQSRTLGQFRPNTNDSLLLRKIGPVHTVRSFNDSLSFLANSLDPQTGTFYINSPSRLVLNVDRSFSGHVFVNAELSVNLSVIGAHSALVVNEMNLLSVTPRWENRHFGFYLPVLYNTYSQLWVGGAVRAGPLLLGVHNLSSLFASNKTQLGGGYLAFIIRAGQHSRESRYKGADCPRF